MFAQNHHAPDKSLRIAAYLAPKRFGEDEDLTLPALKELKACKPDVVLFPEEYAYHSQPESLRKIEELAAQADAAFLVGVFGDVDDDEDFVQCLQLLDAKTQPSGQRYYKHTAAGTGFVGWEMEDWEEETYVDPFEIRGRKIGATICHDLYLGGLQRAQTAMGAEVLLNSTYFNVQDEKWGTLARLRALENGVPMIVTLHADGDHPRHHPFAFDANGMELQGIRAKDGVRRLPDEMHEAGNLFVFDLPRTNVLPRLSALKRIPESTKNIMPNLERDGSVEVHLRHGRLSVGAAPDAIRIARIEGIDILNLAAVFQEAHAAWEAGQKLIIWNQWDEMHVPAARIVQVAMGRTLEFCAPVVVTDTRTIHEITELATDTKTLRRCAPNAAKAWVDMKRAFGLDAMLRITTNHLKTRYANMLASVVMERYRSLFD